MMYNVSHTYSGQLGRGGSYRELLADEEIRQALEICEEAAYSESELAAYEHYWMEISNEKAMLSDSREEGRAEGLKEGLIQGERERRKLQERIEALERLVDKLPPGS